MRQLSKHDVNKLSIAKLLELLPVEITNDGVVVAIISDVNNVDDKPKAKHDVNNVSLYGRFSKEAQASGRMRS